MHLEFVTQIVGRRLRTCGPFRQRGAMWGRLNAVARHVAGS